MPYTDSEIATLALSHLGHGDEIDDLANEDTKEARAIRAVWNIARRKALGGFRWPFAKKVAELSLLGESPTSEWGYSYTYPPDCLDFHKILSGLLQDTEDTAVPYEMAYGEASQVIYTNQAGAEGQYTRDVEDVGRWPDDFALAHSFYLAHLVAPRILGGDPGRIGQRALDHFFLEVSRAKARAKNEERKGPPPEAGIITARDA